MRTTPEEMQEPEFEVPHFHVAHLVPYNYGESSPNLHRRRLDLDTTEQFCSPFQPERQDLEQLKVTREREVKYTSVDDATGVVGGTAGAVGGAAIGAMFGGPVGAVVGAGVGAVAGYLATGHGQQRTETRWERDTVEYSTR